MTKGPLRASVLLSLMRAALAFLLLILLGLFLFSPFAFSRVAGETVLEELAPDLILTNGKVVTLDDAEQMVQAVAIRRDRIVGVGSNETILSLASKKTRILDVGVRLVLPGFVDAHSHTTGAPQTTWISTGPTRSPRSCKP